MTALGMPVPPGFVVPADALATALADTVARSARARARRGRDHDRREEAQALVGRRSGGLPRAIAEAYARARRGDVPVAVRSSATRRGLRGRQLRRPAGDLPARPRRRRRSSSASATAGRRSSPSARCSTASKKGSLDDLGMAVVVQRMVAARRRRRAVHLDPCKGRRDRMVVEAVFGLGEGVVSGQVTPDHYVLTRDGRSASARACTRSPTRSSTTPTAASESASSAPEGGEAQTLGEDQLARAGEGRRSTSSSGSAARRTSSGRSQDDELFVLQSRPVTT